MKRNCEESCKKVMCKRFYREHQVYIRYYLNDDGSLYIAHFNGCSVYEVSSFACTQCGIEVMNRFKAAFDKDSTQ